jgi:peptidoglycan-N-acetylglucosamine deacetylase
MPIRPMASVSLDLDNLWSYLKTHGDAGWERRPTYLPGFVPPVLDLLDQLGLRITFFVVGVDADREENAGALAAITARGHEVGNHSYEHEPWLHRYSAAQLEEEIARADEAVTRATGQRPVGFRGPGYSWSPTLLEVLQRRGYLFDSSTLPTYIGPLARAYYFATAKLSRAARAERAALFGTVQDGLRPVKPYAWRLGDGPGLLEIPVTTIPGLKLPFHLSYLLYLSRYSEVAAIGYLRSALALCRLTGTEPCFLLHPLDLVGGDQAPQLRFFPGMDLGTERKQRFFLRVLETLGRWYTPVAMSTHARSIIGRGGLRVRRPVGLETAPAEA